MTTLPAAGSTVCTAATITSLSPLLTLSVNVGRAESENEIKKRKKRYTMRLDGFKIEDESLK